MMNFYDKQTKYFEKHPFYNSLIHASDGIAVGILIARPFDGGHPLQLAGLFGLIAIVGHLIPSFMRKIK